MTADDDTVIRLPENFIGKEDEARLESFGGHLVAHGAVTRWHWRRVDGVDVAFELLFGNSDADVVARIRRESERDLFYAEDAAGHRIVEGTLDRVMANVDATIGSSQWEPPA